MTEEQKWDEVDRELDKIGDKYITDIPAWDGEKIKRKPTSEAELNTKVKKLNSLAEKIRGTLAYAE